MPACTVKFVVPNPLTKSPGVVLGDVGTAVVAVVVVMMPTPFKSSPPPVKIYTNIIYIVM